MIIQTTKQLRPRDPRDYYPTPYELCLAALRKIAPQWGINYDGKNFRILDPGAGDGVWGKAARTIWPKATIVGIEKYPDKTGEHKEYYDSWLIGDYQDFCLESDEKFHFIIGNPPYKEAMEFILKSFSLTEQWGSVYFLMRLAYLESQRRYKFFQEKPPKHVSVLSRRPSYTGDGKTDSTAYCMIEWQQWDVPRATTMNWLMWDYEVS